MFVLESSFLPLYRGGFAFTSLFLRWCTINSYLRVHTEACRDTHTHNHHRNQIIIIIIIDEQSYYKLYTFICTVRVVLLDSYTFTYVSRRLNKCHVCIMYIIYNKEHIGIFSFCINYYEYKYTHILVYAFSFILFF